MRCTAPLAFLSLALVAGCSPGSIASDSGGASPSNPGNNNGANGGAAVPGSNTPGSGSGAGPGGGADPMTPQPPPPEVEQQQEFEVPRGGARFVYVANRGRDSVSVIDSTALAIRTVPVGDAPAALSTVEGQDVALVINAGTRDLNILRTDGAGATAVARVPVVPGANRVSVAPGGQFAVAWFDSAVPGAIRTSGGSFQEVTVVKLAAAGDSASDLTVGFRPSEVVFAQDGSGAFVVTEDGISIIRFAELKGATVAPFARFPDAGAKAPAVRDVSVTPDGKWAIARREGATAIMLLDLGAAGAPVISLELGAAITDLDLAANGAFALAVLRAESAFVRIPVPAGFAPGAVNDKRVLTGESVGSAVLTRDGTRAVLFTTVMEPPVERLVVVDTSGSATPVAPLPVPLKKTVRTVALAPDGKTAIVLHGKANGDPRMAGIDVETEIDRSFGYTIVNLATGFPKLQLTQADVAALALTPDGARAFVMLKEPRLVQRIALASFIVDEFALGSPPTSLAVLSPMVKRVFVSQDHPEGRISFINWETGVTESVTGFELNGRIVQ